jgi:hypothetical protein
MGHADSRFGDAGQVAESPDGRGDRGVARGDGVLEDLPAERPEASPDLVDGDPERDDHPEGERDGDGADRRERGQSHRAPFDHHEITTAEHRDTDDGGDGRVRRKQVVFVGQFAHLRPALYRGDDPDAASAATRTAGDVVAVDTRGSPASTAATTSETDPRAQSANAIRATSETRRRSRIVVRGRAATGKLFAGVRGRKLRCPPFRPR